MNNRLNNLFRQPWFIPSSVGFATFVGGFSLGYLIGKRDEGSYITVVKKEIDIEDQESVVKYIETKEEISETVKIQSRLNHPSAIAISHIDTPEPEEGKDFYYEEPTVIPKFRQITTINEDGVTNVFNVHLDGEWDYEIECSTRTPEKPYVLHRREFFDDELGYDQITLSYYEEDDILTDDLDTPIYNYSETVGELKFGHGSGDPNVVYIRNERLRAEYEVLFSSGSYQLEVLGTEFQKKMESDDLKHSARKFRLE
jgi:hypothetical protein